MRDKQQRIEMGMARSSPDVNEDRLTRATRLGHVLGRGLAIQPAGQGDRRDTFTEHCVEGLSDRGDRAPDGCYQGGRFASDLKQVALDHVDW